MMVRMALMILPCLPIILPLSSSGAVIFRVVRLFSVWVSILTAELSSRIFWRMNSRVD